MTDQEIVLKLLNLAQNNPNEYVNPSLDEQLKTLGTAAIAGWLEELGRIGLVGDVQPIFTNTGGNFKYKLTAEAFEILKDQERLNKKLSAILPDLVIKYDVFISYSIGDSESAQELSDKLNSKGFSCFLAEAELEIGKRWMESIHAAIKGSRIVIVLLTPRSINRPWVLIETGAAWALDKPLVPALKFVDTNQIVDPLKEYQGRVIETSNQVDRLVTEVSELIGE
ncbi:MAG: toll/interleukin-1 receptor domain-containing protein [Bacteroidota bacterium]